MTNIVPTYNNLASVYATSSNLAKQESRYQNLLANFQQAHKQNVQFFARAPGRVNIIGEHIDYSGYGVLPMALENDAVTAVSISTTEAQDAAIRVHISSPIAKYSTKTSVVPLNGAEFATLEQAVTIVPESHHWTNYVLCALKGIGKNVTVSALLAELKDKKQIDICLTIDGTVPTGSGLSSSSALVCSTALAFQTALHQIAGNAVPILNKTQLAELTAKCEQYVGIQSGGMDQAISMLGEPYLAQYITFEPSLANKPVPIPNGIQFIVSHTLVASNKKETASTNYNRRVVECRFAVAILAQQLLKQVLPQFQTLNWLQKQCNFSFAQMQEAIEKYLHKGTYSIDEVAQTLGMSVEQLRETYIKSIGKVSDEHLLKLHDRALHVITEASRVLEFMDECSKETPSIEKLGALLNDSQSSNATLYECSCAELDELTSKCRASEGCLGSRLTGAGWGGCSISLVREDAVPAFLDQVFDKYYASKATNGDGEVYAREDVLFASKASQGAALVKLQ